MSSSPSVGSIHLGFLTILEDTNGIQGGYLVTNSWGRPVEFRMSTAVQPNQVQRILYGPTLRDYICAELIAKTLVEKTPTPAQLLVTDSMAVLPVRQFLDVPVLLLAERDAPEVAVLPPGGLRQAAHARTSGALHYAGKRADEDGPRVAGVLAEIDSALDLSEPFGRVREAMAEARKLGVTNRAA